MNATIHPIDEARARRAIRKFITRNGVAVITHDTLFAPAADGLCEADVRALTKHNLAEARRNVRAKQWRVTLTRAGRELRAEAEKKIVAAVRKR